MTRAILLLLAATALTACGKGAEKSAAAAANHVAPKLPAFDPANAVSIQSVNACYLDAAAVGTAMGAAYENGTPMDIAPEMRTCLYSSDAGQIRVNVTYVAPDKVDAFRAKPVEGAVDYVAGDADNAAFQVASDGSTCAVTFMRANLAYDMRLMRCKGVEGAKEKLLKLPRPE